MLIRLSLIFSYIFYCIRLGVAPWRYFQLNAPYFNEQRNLFSKLDMDKVFTAISNGAAQSWQMDNRFKTMIENRFDFGFAVDLMIKDLKIAINHAKTNHLELEISKNVLKKYKKLSSKNMGNLDTSSLIKLFDL